MSSYCSITCQILCYITRDLYNSVPGKDDPQSSGSDLSMAPSDESIRDEVQEVQKLEQEDTLTASPSSVPKIVPQSSALAISPW